MILPLREIAAADYREYMIHGTLERLKELQDLDYMDYITDEELETLYGLGYNFFTFGKYHAAQEIFKWMTAYAPYTAHYWRALGAVNQQLKDYSEAIASYDMAIANDEVDVVSYVYRAESQILSGNVEGGLEDLERVVSIGAAYTEFEAWVIRSELLLSLHKPSP